MLTTPRDYGKLAYNGIVSLFLAGLVAWVGWGLVAGGFARWQRDQANDRAAAAEQGAANALRNAASANRGAANATQTRQATDALVIDVRGLTDIAARRIEDRAPFTPQDTRPDQDVLAELEAANARVEVQARRLRGKQ